MRRLSYITINNENKGDGDPHGLNFYNFAFAFSEVILAKKEKLNERRR